MSRSYRHQPIRAITTSRSEKTDKRIWHARLRARERTRLESASAEQLEAHAGTRPREVSDPWGMSKDGKTRMRLQTIRRILDAAAMRGRNRVEGESLAKRALAKLFSK